MTKRTYVTRDGWVVIAEEGYGWLPGYYDSVAAARAAAELPPESLSELSNRICRVDGEDRPMTAADIECAKDAVDDQRDDR
jgi:hypothetical protein